MATLSSSYWVKFLNRVQDGLKRPKESKLGFVERWFCRYLMDYWGFFFFNILENFLKKSKLLGSLQRIVLKAYFKKGNKFVEFLSNQDFCQSESNSNGFSVQNGFMVQLSLTTFLP